MLWIQNPPSTRGLGQLQLTETLVKEEWIAILCLFFIKTVHMDRLHSLCGHRQSMLQSFLCCLVLDWSTEVDLRQTQFKSWLCDLKLHDLDQVTSQPQLFDLCKGDYNSAYLPAMCWQVLEILVAVIHLAFFTWLRILFHICFFTLHVCEPVCLLVKWRPSVTVSYLNWKLTTCYFS